MKKHSSIPLLFALLVFLVVPTLEDVAASEHTTLRRQIETMKTAPRGPFARIRWFCNDGTILPPKSYACKDHGGGRQHGEWTDEVKQMRADGYLIANVLADLDTAQIVNAPGYSDYLNQILIEQFLIAANDGWIFRKARYYRGALQAENETAGARKLLLGMANQKAWIGRGYLPLRSGARLLDHGVETGTVAEIRQHALALSKKDPDFMTIRVKIHNRPGGEDAKVVREYAARVKDANLKAEYEQLAANIDKVYAREALAKVLKQLQTEMADYSELAQSVRSAVEALENSQDPAVEFGVTAKLMAEIRRQLPRVKGGKKRLALIDASLALEVEHFTAATALTKRLGEATRRECLTWLQDSFLALYGAGLLSELQLKDLQKAWVPLKEDTLPLGTYKELLDYLARVPGWGSQWTRFHFFDSEQKLAGIEPLANYFTQDQLRGSPLFSYSNVLNELLRDANQMIGLPHELFGKEVGGGLRSLNPGLARGTLKVSSDGSYEDMSLDGIYLLSETVAELPPVAGILTAGEGNPLSHVQLLARNLGIPNVAVDQNLIPKLTGNKGEKVILAASPAGAVQLALDKGQLDDMFSQQGAPEILIRPDLEKLDLKERDLVPLSKLRASDSGRIVGPKAAKLGELRHQYPEAVADGLAIPFGIFRGLLDQPRGDGQQTMFDWIVSEYDRLQKMPPDSKEREKATEAFRSELEEWILKADPGDAFREQLRSKMAKVFGKDGTYGVFVRSDTNVEDLPGFTGAGLNLTVANVVGFENVLKAISRVWASPFTKRAFAWRQAHMEDPEHVYASILLLQSVPSEKSGVMVTQDIDTSEDGWLSVVVNEGVGGGVDGQAAESLRINTQTGEVRRLAPATATWRKVVEPTGGVTRKLVTGAPQVLDPKEIDQLIKLAGDLPTRFPAVLDAAGKPAPADIEFGFLKGELKLFQIRPFLESGWARQNAYLTGLDKDMAKHINETVRLNEKPR
ncbi:MAG: hypothetical protein JRJ47_03080 [Deltaproteobacteria bacterium]|nr:hypothetical protein [Deltaproteobacteria bacterium]